MQGSENAAKSQSTRGLHSPTAAQEKKPEDQSSFFSICSSQGRQGWVFFSFPKGFMFSGAAVVALRTSQFH